jgi:hypothetical protein
MRDEQAVAVIKAADKYTLQCQRVMLGLVSQTAAACTHCSPIPTSTSELAMAHVGNAGAIFFKRDATRVSRLEQ